LPAERLDILKRTMQYHGRTAQPVDYFEHDLPRIWLVSDAKHEPRRDVIGLFNWDDAEQTFDCPLGYLGLNPKIEYVAFDFWGNRLLNPSKERLRATLPGQSCLVLALRAKADHPQIISTSRHVTQGMIDVLEEKWDPSTRTLAGRSKVIGGTPYELRIAGTASASPTIELGSDSKQAGDTAKLTVEGQLLRVRITSSADREVSWAVRFE
jgi:hypothetical protein